MKLRDFLKNLRHIIVFVEGKNSRTLYQIAMLYSKVLFKLENLDFLHNELNAINILFSKIEECPTLTHLTDWNLTGIVFLLSRTYSSLGGTGSIKWKELTKRIIMDIRKRNPKWYEQQLVMRSLTKSMPKICYMWPELKQDLFSALSFHEASI